MTEEVIDKAIEGAPVTADFVNKVVAKSNNSEYLRDKFYNFFEGLDEPCTVSIGVNYKGQVEDVVKILRENGIDAVSSSSPEAKDVSRFIVDETGIKTPLLEPHGAVLASADIADILKEKGMTLQGRLLPQTAKNLVQNVYIGDSKIDVAHNLEYNPQLKEKFEKNGTNIDEFVKAQRQELANMPAVDVENLVRENIRNGMPSVYRGGTLGNRPYAVVAGRREKDVVYASPNFNTARGYARGSECQYSGSSTGVGFIYEYAVGEGQVGTEDFGIESGSHLSTWEDLSSSVKVGENGMIIGAEDVYETPVFPHKNKLKNVYVSDGSRVVKITDDNGKYLTKDLEDFAELHNAYGWAKTEVLKERSKNQLAEATSRSGNEYARLSHLKVNAEDVSKLDLETYLHSQCCAEQISFENGTYNIKGNLALSGKESKVLDGVSLNVEKATLKDMSYPSGLKVSKELSLTNVEIPDGADLGGVQELKLQKVTFGKDVKLPEKLTMAGNIPDGMDLSGVQELKLQKVTFGKDVKLPEKLTMAGKIPDGMDLSGVKDLKLKSASFRENVVLPNGADLSGVKNLEFGNGAKLSKDMKFPENVTLSYGCKIPEGMDLSGVKNLTLDVAKLPEGVKLPENVCFAGTIPEGADLSGVKNVVVRNCEDVNDVNKVLALPDDVAVKFEGAVKVENAETAQKLLKKDLSEAYLEVADDKVLKGVEIPADVPVVKIDEANMQVVAVSTSDKLKKDLETKFSGVEGLSVNYVTPEEFEKQSGATFVKASAVEKTANMAVEDITESAAIKEIKEKAAASAAKFEAKVEAKSGSAAVKTAADLTAKKSGILAKVAAANAKFDKAVDKTVEKGAQALNNSAVGKAYHKAAEKVGKTKAAQIVTKTVSKGAQKVASTTAGKAVTKTVAKVAGSAVGKSILKKIPLVSAGAGAYFAWQRIKDGQWKLAGCEMVSGIAGCFPGLGTAASVAIDAGLVANDIHEVVKSNKEAATTNTTSEKIAQAKPKVLPKPKSTDFEKKDEKKEVKKTTLTTAQQLAFMNKSRE